MEVRDAVKNLKTVGSELTVWENRLDIAKAECEKNQKMRDALQAEIDKKTSDFGIYIAQRDAENKKTHSEVLEAREKLESDKSEFQMILKQHQQDKAALDSQKHEFEIQRLKHASTVENVQQFILAVRRASGLLGI